LTTDRLNLDILITDDGIADIDYTSHWIDLLLYELRNRNDSFSFQLYQRSLLLQVVFAAAKYLATTNRVHIPVEFLADLRALLQQSVNAYKYQPQITPTEAAWLDRLTLPHDWKSNSAPSVVNPQIDRLPIFNPESDSLATLMLLTTQHQERLIELQTRPNIENITTELAELSASVSEIERHLTQSISSAHRN
jgi:HAMP domain-containing protein